MNIDDVAALGRRLHAEIGKAVIGQDEAINRLLIALFASGHVLLEGPPGTAKTFLAQCFSRTLSLDFSRIQFTPDLMPSDIIGASLFNFQTSSFSLTRGPVFTDILLADEINRTPPKTQAALLEAMQERIVTIDGEPHALGDHFLVIATQNPVEQQGVYPLPEAQLDRFMFKLDIGYPDEEAERRIVAQYGNRFGAPKPADYGIEAIATGEDIKACAEVIKAVSLVDEVTDYVVRLVRASRNVAELSVGASPRAAVVLAGAARAHAALDGRDYTVPDDVKLLARSVLRHRVMLSPQAEIDGRSVDEVVETLIATAEAPR